jgi:hypothetical protein
VNIYVYIHSLSFTVFLHEFADENFTQVVDGIMKNVQSKHSDIEINYRKIPHDRQMSEKLKDSSELTEWCSEVLMSLHSSLYVSFFFSFHSISFRLLFLLYMYICIYIVFFFQSI